VSSLAALFSAAGLLVDQRRLHSAADVRPVLEAELGKDRTDVAFNRAIRHRELPRDRAVALTGREQGEHLLFAWAQDVQSGALHLPPAAHHLVEDLRVEVRLPPGDAADDPHELVRLRDPVLEDVGPSLRAAREDE